MKSWSKRELALAVLVVLAAIFVPYAAVPLLARLEQLLSSCLLYTSCPCFAMAAAPLPAAEYPRQARHS